jgi:anti-anti-sigma regulatory factor
MSGWDDEPASDFGAWAAAPLGIDPQPDLVDAPGAIRLDANTDARALRDALLALPAGDPVRIDASQVERLSGSVLQLLLVAVKHAEAADSRLTIVDPSFAFSLAFEAFGLGGTDEPFNVEYS